MTRGFLAALALCVPSRRKVRAQGLVCWPVLGAVCCRVRGPGSPRGLARVPAATREPAGGERSPSGHAASCPPGG